VLPELLQIRHLKTYFLQDGRDVPAVDGVSLTVKRGETLALVGESGCGKSMTSLSILRLIPDRGKIVAGEVVFEGQDLLQKSDKEMSHLRGNEISIIFQEPMTAFNPVLTIGDQMMEGLRVHQQLSKRAARERVIDLLKQVGLPQAAEMLKRYPHQLSGGMRQRVMIAMAMTTSPKLLLADEPTTALDVTMQAQILQLMKEMQEKYATSLLLITHDLGIVAEMADRVLVMYAGKVVEEADVVQLFENPSHPYTVGLLKSLPSLTEEQTRLYSIGGHVPSLDQLPSGCRFAPRCDKAWERCFQAEPELQEIKHQHQVRCFLYQLEEGDDQR
jgi:peptide/nickel transport system ATP-binding protein